MMKKLIESNGCENFSSTNGDSYFFFKVLFCLWTVSISQNFLLFSLNFIRETTKVLGKIQILKIRVWSSTSIANSKKINHVPPVFWCPYLFSLRHAKLLVHLFFFNKFHFFSISHIFLMFLLHRKDISRRQFFSKNDLNDPWL